MASSLGLPVDDVGTLKSSGIKKYTAAATTLLRSKRNNGSKESNKLLPAYILPSEILCKIFIYCARIPSKDDLAWSWVNVTFVCSTWRRAALQCHELWSYIDFSHPRWTSLTLHRAQTLPISIRAVVEAHNQRSLHRALQFAPKIHEIHLTSSIDNIGPLMGIFKQPNHFLESLTLEISRPEDNRDIRYSKRSYPANGPPLPCLKRLELHRSPFGLVLSRYTGLTHLSLHHLPFSERPTRHDFLSVLERFTMLEHLTLVRAFPKNIVAGNLSPGRTINLPNLLSLSLTGSAQEMVNIMDCMTLQPAVRFHFYVDRMGDFKTNFWKLAILIGTHFHGAAWAMPLDTLVVTGREESFRFTENHELNPDFRQALRLRAFGLDADSPNAVLDLIIGPDSHTSHDDILVTALVSIWDTLPLAHIHTLTLRNLDIITQKSWSRLLSSLQSLRVLDIGGHPPSGLIWALLLNARSHSHLEHDDTDSILLPRLDDIYLHNIDCFAGGMMVSHSALVNSHCDLDDSRFLDVLLVYLEDRHRCGLALRSLCISHCTHVSREVLEELRTCAAHLLWDNRGLYKGEDLNPESPATYRNNWTSTPPVRRHFHRLKMLLEQE